MLAQAITANRDTHGCCVSSRLYAAAPEALETPAGMARDSQATQEELSAHRWVWAGKAHHKRPWLWWQTNGRCQARTKNAGDEEG